MKQITLGSLESISLPALGVFDVLAKVDTGAWSGALHCTNIHERDGVLSFWPLGDKRLKIQTNEYNTTSVRSTNGQSAKRYLISTKVVIDGTEYDTVIGLSDRTTMTREMLLGRRFLIENNVVVDVSKTKDMDNEAEKFL